MAERISALHHQFDDLEQQRESATLGMWLFLVTEILFFGGLFLGYTVYRMLYGLGFDSASNELHLLLGTVNTAVLIGSSCTMAFAVYCAQRGRRGLLVLLLLATICLGGCFLIIKGFEWRAEIWSHHFPGRAFYFPGPYAPQAELFFCFYFFMTALHALHVTVGLGVLSGVALQALRGRYSPEYHAAVEVAGLYWHFVDIVWIFLYPLLYLGGRHL